MFVGVPVAIAVYTGSYAPTQSVAPRVMSTPVLSCSGGNSANLSWTDPDGATADPHTAGTFVSTGYVTERSVSNAPWEGLSTLGRLVTTDSDNDFGGLSIGTQIRYRVRATRSTNWVSPDSNIVTASVTSILFLIRSVSC
jgi:hypothetical protein